MQNGTLPQVAQIEPASAAGLDEHGSDTDQYPINIQLGANYVSSLINALMTSVSWKDSVFILTYDEFGGLYDHVARGANRQSRRHQAEGFAARRHLHHDRPGPIAISPTPAIGCR